MSLTGDLIPPIPPIGVVIQTSHKPDASYLPYLQARAFFGEGSISYNLETDEIILHNVITKVDRDLHSRLDGAEEVWMVFALKGENN